MTEHEPQDLPDPHEVLRKFELRLDGKAKGRYWSGYVTRHSNALDLEPQVFASDSPRQIAQSLKRSAETSKRRKGTPCQSAMSMLKLDLGALQDPLAPVGNILAAPVDKVCGCGSPMSAAQAPGKVRFKYNGMVVHEARRWTSGEVRDGLRRPETSLGPWISTLITEMEGWDEARLDQAPPGIAAGRAPSGPLLAGG